MSFQNKMVPVFSITLLGLMLIFSRMLGNLMVGSLEKVNQSEMFQIVFKMLPYYE